MQIKNWKINKLTEKAVVLSKTYNILPITAQILLNRGIKESDLYSFLNPSLSQLHSAKLLPDIDKAVERIRYAISNNQKIFVLGDYDVDGITSLAIFYNFIKEYKNFCFYIPDRIKDGYGLTKKVVEKAKEEDSELLICFDCGTNSNSEIELAKNYNIETIVIDHHYIKNNINAFAFINPKRKDSNYPFSHLSSAAISFKLLQELKKDCCYEVLDLVALSLVCDVVPICGENRIILKEGLNKLKKTTSPWLCALCDISKIRKENIDVFHLGYILGPRINAAGRIAYAKDSLDIFLTDKKEVATNLASKLQEYNQIRRSIELKVLEEAESIIDRELINDYAFIVYGEDWHPGVLGIVASKLVEKYYRPSFVFSFKENILRGSARSIDSIHLIEVLDKCSDLLNLYGGHKKAAGLELDKENLEKFKEKVNSIISTYAKDIGLSPTIEIDLDLSFKDISLRLLKEIKKLEPFGEENPKPLFVTFGVLKRSDIKKINNHYSVWLTNDNITLEGILYDKELIDTILFADKLDIVYELDYNNYYNAIRLIIKDIKINKDA